MLTVVDISPVQSFVTALVERDFAKLEQTLSEHLQFRALVPPGLRERDTAAAARELIENWFADAEIFDVQYSTIEALGDCVHAGYRVRARENAEWYLCEQHLFAQTSAGQIDSLSLICSGFRPAPQEPVTASRGEEVYQRDESARTRLESAMSRSPA
jgi:hypothetical protein